MLCIHHIYGGLSFARKTLHFLEYPTIKISEVHFRKTYYSVIISFKVVLFCLFAKLEQTVHRSELIDKNDGDRKRIKTIRQSDNLNKQKER